MANVFIEESILQGWADTIREKTGTTDTMLPSTMLTKTQEEWGTGSGDSDLVKYVTFMSFDGATEYFKMPVLSGDDCKDPVSHGDIDKPTKESTNTINYTHNGWSLVSGGSADSTALKNVTEDRVVYASFAESVRYYTVNFYTEVGVLYETVQVTYGGTAEPSVAPSKSGYGFDGWSPSNENITADTDCFAIWTETITFANASWSDIARISESGKAPSTFSLGDTKSFEMTIADGTIQTVTFMIVGFNHDTLSDGSGKAGITLMQVGHMNDLIVQGDIGIMTAEETKYLPLLPSELSVLLKSVNKMFDNNTVSSKIWGLDVNEILDNYTTTTYVDAFDTSTTLFPVFEGKSNAERASLAGYVGESGNGVMIRSKRTIAIPKCRGVLGWKGSAFSVSRTYDSGLASVRYKLCFCI